MTLLNAPAPSVVIASGRRHYFFRWRASERVVHIESTALVSKVKFNECMKNPRVFRSTFPFQRSSIIRSSASVVVARGEFRSKMQDFGLKSMVPTVRGSQEKSGNLKVPGVQKFTKTQNKF